jgi:hypothetical protein
MGGATITLAIVRLIAISYWAALQDNVSIPSWLSYDDLEYLSYIFTAECEAFSAIVVACLPAFRALGRELGSEGGKYETEGLMSSTLRRESEFPGEGV